MLQNLAHEVLVDLVRGHETIHGWRVVKRVDGGLDSGIACRRGKTGSLEQVLAVDNHLCPAIDRNRGCHAVKLGHGDGTRREGILLQRVNDVGIGLDIKNAGFGPRQHILQRVIDDIGKGTGGECGRRPRAKVFLLNRNHLDRVACLLVEILSHRLLLGKTLGLVFGRPEADRIRLCDARDKGGDHRRRCR